MDRTSAIMLICLSTFMAATVHGGNTRSFFFGDEAAMTAGAGVAVVRDSGALWYNPAGLGGLTLSHLELGGNAYHGEFRRIDDFLTADLPGGAYATNAKDKGLGGVPTSTVLIYNFSPKLSAGVGVFRTEDDYMEFVADIEDPYGTGAAMWHQSAAVYRKQLGYHLGPSLGIALTPRLRFGVSLYISYHSQIIDLQLSAAKLTEGDSDNDAFMSVSEHEYVGRFGLTLRSGMQWEFAPNWHAALVFSSPNITIVALGDSSRLASGMVASGDIPDSVFAHDQDDYLEGRFEPRESGAFQVALAYKTPQFWMGAEGELRPPMKDENIRFLWNTSLGARVTFSEKLNWGIGVFTDNSQTDTLAVPLDDRLNRYGINTGLALRVPLTFTGERGKRTVFFSVAMAVTYAVSVGDIAAVRLDPEMPMLDFPARTAVFHQTILYLGTSLYF